MLGDLETLGLLSQRRTVSGAVLADNADLSCALGHSVGDGGWWWRVGMVGIVDW